jgi:ABC-type transport system involved in multi-copper enzyme maturation permease subunit
MRRIPSAYRHDLRWTLASRVAIALGVLTILGSASTIYIIQAAAIDFGIMGSGLYYYEDGAYHLSVWVYDEGGNPVPGVVAVFSVQNYSVYGFGVGRAYSGTSNAQGELSVVMPYPDQSNATLFLESVHLLTPRIGAIYWGGILATYANWLLGYLAPGAVQGINTFTTVSTSYYSAHTQIMVFAEDSDGTLPTGLLAETCSYFEPPQGFVAVPIRPDQFPPPEYHSNCTELPTVALGAIRGFWTHLPLPDYSASVNTAIVQLVNSTGGIVEEMSMSTTNLTGGGSSVITAASGVFVVNTFAYAMGFLLPLMALVATYWTYARQRLSGWFEPVLSRPVTRGGLLLARFASVTTALSAAALASVLILDAGVASLLQEPLPPVSVAALVGGLLVAGIGCASLLFLGAHWLRSRGAVMALGIAIVVGMGLFWSDMFDALLFWSHTATTSVAAANVLVGSLLFAVPQFPGLATSFLTGVTLLGVPVGNSVAGVNVVGVAAIGVAWVLIPLLLAYHRAVTRD